MAGRYDFSQDQGATWEIVATWKIDGVAVNLTGYSARLQLRVGYETEDPTLDLTTDDGGGIVLGGSAGTITVTVSAEDTAAIAAGEYRYDLEVESSGGVVKRLLEGLITVKREVTR